LEVMGGAVLRTAALALFLGIGCTVVSAPAQGAGVSADSPAGAGLSALRRRLDGAWSSVRTYRADLTWPDLRSDRPGSAASRAPGKGTFLYQRPDRWLLEFRSPDYEKYEVVGDEGWVVIGRLRQAVHYRLLPRERAQGGGLILGQPTSELARFYVLGDRPTAEDRRLMGAGAPALTLVPRRPGSLAVKRAVLFLDPATYLPRKVRIQLESGDELRIHMSRPVKNGRLDPRAWAVSLPESVHVVEQ
jgi:hypothetical protein